MLKKQLKRLRDIDYLVPAVFQASALFTLPLLAYQAWWLACIAIVLALVYHLIGIVVAGHMIISHRRTAGWLDAVYHVIFFFTTFITPGNWAAYHIQHHKHTDTPLDPQSPADHGLKVLLITGWDPKLKDLHTLVEHRSYKLSVFFEKNYWKLMVFPIMAFLMLPAYLVILLWAAPASLALSLGTLSAYLTHLHGEPRNMTRAEAVLLLGEGQDHRIHHGHAAINSGLASLFYD